MKIVQNHVIGVLLVLLAWPSASGRAAESSAPIQATLVSAEKIWDAAPHNAFTDLIRWQDSWYCAFREAEKHVAGGGKLRILASSDGESWHSAATLEDDVYDLRDANLTITPGGELMAVGGAQRTIDGKSRTGTFVSFSGDGEHWQAPEIIVPPGRWLWGVTWHKQQAWGVSYPAPDRTGVSSLLVSNDGRKYTPLVKEFLTQADRPTEARLRFGTDGRAYCLHRCDGPQNHAYLGVAAGPYAQWEWKQLDRYIGGPNFIQLPSGRWLGGGRLLIDGAARTSLLEIDFDEGRVSTILTLPSGGDTSYPGLVWHEGMLWVSYYSSHEGKTSIYLAKVEIDGEPQ